MSQQAAPQESTPSPHGPVDGVSAADSDVSAASEQEPWGGDEELRRTLMAERFGPRLQRERPPTPDEKRRRK